MPVIVSRLSGILLYFDRDVDFCPIGVKIYICIFNRISYCQDYIYGITANETTLYPRPNGIELATCCHFLV